MDSISDIHTAMAVSQRIHVDTGSTVECMRVQHCLIYLQLKRIADALEDTNTFSRWGDRRERLERER